LFKHLFGLLRLADLEDQSFMGELDSLLGHRLFEVVDLHHAEVIGLHSSLEGRSGRGYGFLGRQFEQPSFSWI